MKLTVTLLAFSIIVVFVGTLAQVDMGLYEAQSHFFKQWVVFGATIMGYKIPLVFPGGYLIGTLLVINLVVSHICRFSLTPKKIGIHLIHAGILVMLVAQLASDILTRESRMRFTEGESRNYSECTGAHELVFTHAGSETSLPESMLLSGNNLAASMTGLPFDIIVKSYWKNSDINFRADMADNGPPLSTQGLALDFDFHGQPPVQSTDQRNVPTALMEFKTPSGSLGEWVASGWAGDPEMIEVVRNNYSELGPKIANKVVGHLVEPQTITAHGENFTFTIRSARIHHPFSLSLLKASHSAYPGTSIPKDFRSRVLLENPATGEKREVEISMNHPLRYQGYSFYQYQVEGGQTQASVLSVVQNPNWLTPYIGSALVGLGLMIQFAYHLSGFFTKRKTR